MNWLWTEFISFFILGSSFENVLYMYVGVRDIIWKSMRYSYLFTQGIFTDACQAMKWVRYRNFDINLNTRILKGIKKVRSALHHRISNH